ncbi:sensor histidine kinase [Arenimonas sp.]|uniref:sensor histidine kinase n=1 Tax=Arenimonas sp. TaxID=1872635 RepID=UPI002E32FCF5|nr:histidine kinase [Arenimonas sp.]HEX4853020.1 histidine kinase [Arenimonas sp.]
MAKRPPPTQPLEALWQPQALTAVLLAGEGLALLLALAPGNPGDRWVHFGLASLMIQWIALLTLGALYALRGALARVAAPRVAWIALSLLVLNALVAGSAAWLALSGADGGGLQGWFQQQLRLCAMTLTVGLLALAAFQNFWRARQLAVLAKQAELEALQARIRPHFLFNTLNTGAALVHARPGEAEQLLLDLSDLFRAALSGESEIPLADELALARRYLEIEALRFGPRLRLSWSLPDPVPAIRVPTLSIQPLVENAIRHGVEPSAEGGAVDVRVEAEGAQVKVIVANDLPRASTRVGPAHAGHQVGLASVRSRIEALTEGRGRVEAGIIDGRYVATLTLPRAL